ncbi:uncharacterized protein LOC119661787 isoform X2 [Hermetia illucens]|uniref:uncharacterized protein LOC119661787 isoform X2 n=1 Tax=Hermetia illucens TaxID=343691 RepID=UPI0018CC18F3|nr:uncharacterized protein LOC119661787 isoform X2 [Hermetia illucens]
MQPVDKFKIIAASVRTTNRINALLNESLTLLQTGKKKAIFRVHEKSFDQEEPEEKTCRTDVKFLRTNFNMDHIYKIAERVIEERLQWDRFNRMYDPWRSVKFAESLATDIKDRVKRLKHNSYRVICIVSIVEKQQQGIDYKLQFLLDARCDNFSNFTYERATYYIVATVFMIHKE